ncbi:calcium/sodium antiporter [Prochlorococcus sp. MIT 1341]|uniref:calcium/sodium antiporter n=1 Tax=Prochlorococcus sp. MIT 1341 TaxID=3096221 RepID=UPI002A74C864|nr:calcium/sodium antiporter [Prochlorococcus sp. MIT 1341]
MPASLLSALEVLIGICLLFGGGEFFVQGSVALALILGIPQLVIGLTVVSLGTSAPELFVSVGSVIKGSDALAVSNVVGSNIFNVMVVLGCSALIVPLKVESRLVRRDVPLLIAISTAVWGMSSTGHITWQSGTALLVALIINSAWEIRTAREEPEEIEEAEPEINIQTSDTNLAKALTLLLSGIVLLSFGSNLLVKGASDLAIWLGVSETVIGLTIVSAGTSMPELITSLVAALKGRTDLAIGNVIGSSLLNQLLVLSSSAIVSTGQGLYVDQLIINRDLPVMVLTTLACMPIFWTKGLISRLEGGILLGLYIFYIVEKVLPHTIPEWQDNFRITIACVVIPAVILIIIFQTLSYWRYLKSNSLR